MCTGACSKFVAIALYPLALVSIICNIILFFPDFNTKYAGEDGENSPRITEEVKYMGGLIGGGLMVRLVPAIHIHLTSARNCCANRCGMFLSIGFAALGVVGAIWSLSAAGLGLANGPTCLWANAQSPTAQWGTPFANRNFTVKFGPWWNFPPLDLHEILLQREKKERRVEERREEERKREREGRERRREKREKKKRKRREREEREREKRREKKEKKRREEREERRRKRRKERKKRERRKREEERERRKERGEKKEERRERRKKGKKKKEERREERREKEEKRRKRKEERRRNRKNERGYREREKERAQGVVEFNLGLFATLLVCASLELILCAVQMVNGLFGCLCGTCGGKDPEENLDCTFSHYMSVLTGILVDLHALDQPFPNFSESRPIGPPVNGAPPGVGRQLCRPEEQATVFFFKAKLQPFQP
ncbi:hypothetical protein WMY93_014016 [Mugilogobius chulae]|uniref:Uncharacterized protein n=1 Tax=Mugilogobius chulae TaxID=88201 RepID=A0AAW0NTT5_9GOBI